MLIDFDKIEATVLKNFNGGEKEIVAKIHIDKMNKIMHGKLIPGASIGLHQHTTGSEILYILNGKGKVLYDGTYEKLQTGSCHYCPKGHTHSLINDSDKDLVFFAVVPEQ